MRIIELHVSHEESLDLISDPVDLPVRVDKYLSSLALEDLISRQFIDKLISEGCVEVNGRTILKKSHLINENDHIVLKIPEQTLTLDDLPKAQNIPVQILFEDNHLAIIDKPAGLTVHPAPGHYDGTLVNALVWAFNGQLSEGSEVNRPGIVHRLDKDTSGLLIVAKDNKTHLLLSEMIQNRYIQKKYQAIILGEMDPLCGEINAPVGRHPNDRKKMTVSKKGKEAVTLYRTLNHYEYFSQVEVDLITGRTHQIRVHFAHKNHPVLGDSLYNSLNQTLSRVPASMQKRTQLLLKSHLTRQALHAWKLDFIHPITEKEMFFESPLPEDFIYTLNWLKENFS